MARDIDLYRQNVGRGNRIPNISLGTGVSGFTPADYDATIFVPQKEDMSLLQRSMQTLDERKEKTDQQRAAIMSAIGNLKLNEAEDKWKRDYADRISARIDSAAQFGDYSAALESATRLAGEALSSPEVTGRLRYQENREKWLSNLENRATRGEIDSDTLARARAENAYAYSDTYDDNGRIIGGTDWKASFEPVKDINLSQVMAEIKSLVTPSSTSKSGKGGTSQVYLDSKGNQTKDINQARGVFATVSGGGSSHSETGVTAQQWADAYDAWISMHPEAAQAFEQKRQNNIWRYKQYMLQAADGNLSQDKRDEAKANADIQYKQLTDQSGAMLSAENYARSIANPMFKVMAYSKTADSSEGGSTLFNKQIGRNRLAGEILGLSAGQAEIYSMASPIEKLALLKNVASTTAGLTDAGKAALNQLQGSFVTSSWGN